LALYENTPLEKAVRICTRLFDDPEVNIRDAAFKITKNKPDAICLFAQAREGKCNFIFAASEEVKVSMNDVMKETMEKLGGKGGGSAQLAQGGIGGKVDLERIIQEAQALVRKKLDESST
ncbi:MAG: DHHA1 domain-containing protein, partial [candidate division KSB1 bacterium]|nr:DHHA1 domain-containing protein [candidate division KSB1 bacterium]